MRRRYRLWKLRRILRRTGADSTVWSTVLTGDVRIVETKYNADAAIYALEAWREGDVA